jgi:mercuric ion binding protein
MEGRGISLLTLLLASAIVLTFAALNVRTYAFAGSPPPPRSTPSENLERVVIRVEGMSCATCEIAIRYALKSVNGVESVRVSAAAKTATVDYDPTKTNPEKLVAAINSTGYRATLPATSPRSRAGAALPREKPESIGETAQHQPSEERISMDRVSLFKVSLECPAAPQIGCGTASKPILLQLEQEPGVA